MVFVSFIEKYNNTTFIAYSTYRNCRLQKSIFTELLTASLLL